MKLSNKIKYSGSITKERFTGFIKILKELDPKEYEKESRDDFLDLYNYWYGLGYRRFSEKFENNIERHERN